MAVTLSFDLNDTEQARLEEIANVVAPGMTPAQIKAWAEKTAKNQLRIRALTLYDESQGRAQRETRLAQIEAMSDDWVEVE